VQNSVHRFSPQTKSPYTLSQFTERKRTAYLRAVPFEFNQGVKIYTPSNADVMPIELSAKKMCFFVAERILTGMFKLLEYPVVRYYVLQQMQQTNLRTKAFMKHSPHSTHTGLLYCTFYSHLARPLRIPGTSQITLSKATVSKFALGRPQYLHLQIKPVFTNFSHHFVMEFADGKFSSTFLLNSRRSSEISVWSGCVAI
jgi:hypothetical protein